MRFYCIIKGRSNECWWIQLYKYVVEADSKKEARSIIEDNFKIESIPMRIRRENVSPESIMMDLYHIENENHFTNDFFITRDCEICGANYRLVDKFNLLGAFGRYELCGSSECQSQWDNKNMLSKDFSYAEPVIYKITQISTGKVYIGKTIRPFTLRWWEHLKSSGLDDKFHSVFCAPNIDITDWAFQVIERLPKNSKGKFILDIEKKYIKKYNSVENGFNSLCGDVNQQLDFSEVLS